MARKKTQDAFNERLGLRISSHEKVCAERMKTLFKTIDELKSEVRQLRNDVSKGKGAVNVLMFLGVLVGSIFGYLKWDG